ncbi:MAG: formate dehydrogenase accessory sulfurtransferase FdhD [Deltaproteobacteria bacterium]
MGGKLSTTRDIERIDAGRRSSDTDRLVVEEPLEIRLAGSPLAVTMRTPGHDEELAAGFALTEGIVACAEDLESVRPCAEAEWGNIVDLKLASAVADKRAYEIGRARREFFLSSSCGLCGKESIDRLRQHIDPIRGDFVVTPAILAALPGQMRLHQEAFAETGGLHAAALFRPTGELVCLREDIGRHNAVDKVIGHELLLGRLPASQGILLVSGRASFELVQKAGRAGIAFLCAISAPSSLAVDLASELGMTIVGFLRDRRLNVYCGNHRVAEV